VVRISGKKWSKFPERATVKIRAGGEAEIAKDKIKEIQFGTASEETRAATQPVP